MDNSPLAVFPPELRNIIYDMVLVLDAPIGTVPSNPRSQHTNPKVGALLRTCQQVRAEAFALFYAHNTFIISAENMHDMAHHLHDWLAALQPEARGLLRRVYVRGPGAEMLMLAEVLAERDLLLLAECRDVLDVWGVRLGRVGLYVKGWQSTWMKA